MTQKLKQFYIISAVLSTKNAQENYWRTKQLRELLEELLLPHKEVLGQYDGHSEVSFVVLCPQSDEAAMLKLGQMFAQESILRVEEDTRDAILLFVDAQSYEPKHVEYLGKFENVPGAIARTLPAYTYDKNTGFYYATVKEGF